MNLVKNPNWALIKSTNAQLGRQPNWAESPGIGKGGKPGTAEFAAVL